MFYALLTFLAAAAIIEEKWGQAVLGVAGIFCLWYIKRND